MRPDAFTESIAALRELGGRHVWSLMVSLFGDLAQGEGEGIEGPVLSAVMTGMGIKPEAARVALHRLRNDGWIKSEKQGRTSRHGLTAEGRRQSLAASPRIYALPGDNGRDWQLVLLQAGPEDVRPLERRGFAPLMPRVLVGPADASPPEGALALPGGDVPDWLRAELEPAIHTRDYAALARTLAALEQELPTALSPAQTAVLRCLIVHNWRRLVLKHPALPAALLLPEWPGLECHRRVARLLSRFPRPSLRELAAP